MPILRTLWKNGLTESNIPEWTCPTCDKGNLTIVKDSLKINESNLSKSWHKEDDWDPINIHGDFICQLQCNNSSCSEVLSVSGEMSVEPYSEYDSDQEYLGTQYETTLYPKLFIPAIKIFHLHKDIPKSIREAVIKSFDLFWVDPSSCGNKIRKIVELILDDQRVPRVQITAKRKRIQLVLHNRIAKFQVMKPNEGDLLMAIKWIGNNGSHQDDLTVDDVLDAYDILELVLNNLYETHSIKIKALSKKINKAKKPISKSSRKRTHK